MTTNEQKPMTAEEIARRLEHLREALLEGISDVYSADTCQAAATAIRQLTAENAELVAERDGLKTWVEDVESQRDYHKGRANKLESDLGDWVPGAKCPTCDGCGTEGNEDRSCSACAGTGDAWKTWKERATEAEAQLATANAQIAGLRANAVENRKANSDLCDGIALMRKEMAGIRSVVAEILGEDKYDERHDLKSDVVELLRTAWKTLKQEKDALRTALEEISDDVVYGYELETGNPVLPGRPTHCAEIAKAALAASGRDAERFRALDEVYSHSRDERGYNMNCMLHYGIKTLPELADMMLARSRHRVEMAAIDAAAKGATE